MPSTAETTSIPIDHSNTEPPVSDVAHDRLTVAFGYDGNLAHNNGVSNYVLTVGDYLKSRGHDVHYLVARTEIDQPNTHVLANTVNIPSNGTLYPQALPVQRKFVKKVFEGIDPDVFHSQLPFQPLVSGRGINYLSPKTAKIGTFHTLAETAVSKAYTRLMARTNRGQLGDFDATFGATPALQGQIKKFFGIEPTLLALPVNVDELSSGKRLAKYDDDKLNLAFLGRLDSRKGCQHLLGALSLLDSDTKSHMRLLIAGDGPLRPELEQTIAENGSEHTVEFLGTIAPEDKPDFYATSDIAIFPATMGESFGLVIAEALAGTDGIVVGGTNPGYRSALDNQAEVLFDPTSPIKTAGFIKNLIRNDTLRDNIRTRQQTLVKTYDINTVGPIIEAAYYAALA